VCWRFGAVGLSSVRDAGFSLQHGLENFILPFARGRREIHTDFWWGNLETGEHWEDLGVDGKIVLKHMLKK